MDIDGRVEMEQFIRKALSEYNKIKAEEALLSLLRNKALECAKEKVLALQEMRLSVIAGWVSILSDPEAFVVTQHLINGVSWHEVASAYCKKASVNLTKSNREMKRAMESALAKIAGFMEPHMDLASVLFADWLTEENVEGG